MWQALGDEFSPLQHAKDEAGDAIVAGLDSDMDLYRVRPHQAEAAAEGQVRLPENCA
jgi:hypothetical protein